MAWSRRFDDPIALPAGKAIVSLEDAANYIQRLPQAAQHAPHWQAATEALIMAAEDRGPLLHADIGIRRALNFGKAAPAPARGRRPKSYRIIPATKKPAAP